MSDFPEFSRLVKKQYRYVRTIGDVAIYKRKR